MVSFECQPLKKFFINKHPQGLSQQQMANMAKNTKNKLRDTVNKKWRAPVFSQDLSITDHRDQRWFSILGIHIEIYINRHIFLTDINQQFLEIEGSWQKDLIKANNISDDEVCALIFTYYGRCLK